MSTSRTPLHGVTCDSMPIFAAAQHVRCASSFIRRGVLLVLVAGMSACATPAPRDVGRVESWTTTSDRRLALSRAEAPMRGAGGPAEDAMRVGIVVDAAARHQRMVGFGASITDASAWLIRHRMDARQRDALLRELFGREGDGVGFDFARLTIGASDFSRSHYSLDDPPGGRPDPELRHFSIDRNLDDVVPVAREALSINPGLKIVASPWSAPAWMKDTDSLIKGTLLPEHYDAFARYLLEYVDAYAAQGVPIFALTVQNEPDYEPADYPGMRLNAPARARFIGDHLGPLRDAHPDKDAYMTECSGGDWEPVRSGGLTLQARTLVIGATRHWARGVLFWNLALDENGGPHAGGCDTCRGVVTVDSRTGEVSRTDDYYALAHASRFVRRDAWRIGSTQTADGIDNVALENADDGSRVLIVSNSNDAPRSIAVRDGDRGFEHVMPARSLVTFRWDGAGGR